MDLNAILQSVAAALPFPWSLVAGAVLVVGYQWLKVRFPDLLARLPNVVHLPPAPGTTPAPGTAPAPPPIPIVPGGGPRFPILSAILGRIFGAGAPPPEQVDPAFLAKLKAEIEYLTAAPPADAK